MLEREQALGRLLQLLGTSERSPGRDDIRAFRGALPWPAAGRVIRSFGRHYLPKYATYTVCNGLRLDVAAGAPVAAIFSGVVAYAQYFKGYGNMVVVDHGRQVFSLVAGLATIFVRVNQHVDMGVQLGLAPPPSEEGNLYLEVRVGDKPQDPQRWLQLQEGRS
jgi:murein hydrolase activator